MRFRSYCLVLLIALVAGACHRGDNAWQQFKAPYLGKGTTIHVRPWMKWGLGAAAALSHDSEAAAMVSILRRMKAVVIHILPLEAVPSSGEIARLSSRLERHGYASLIAVRSSGARVNLWARDEERVGEMRDPLVVIRDQDVMVLVEMTGVLRADDLNTLLARTGSFGSAAPQK